MVKIEKGGTYKATRFRSGENDRGYWELIVVKAEGKARQTLTLFPTNTPTGISEKDEFVIKEITGVAVKQKQDSNGNWSIFDTNVWAEVEKVEVADLEDLGGDIEDIFNV